MRITEALRSWLVAKGWILADDTTEQITRIVTTKLTSGELTPETLDKLTKEYDQKAEGRAAVQAMIDQALTARGVGGTGTGTRGGSTGPNPHQLFGGAGGGTAVGGSVRVLPPSSGYSTVKSAATHRKFGHPVIGPDGAPVENASQREKAYAGAFLAFVARRSGVTGIPWSDHMQSLLDELINDTPWTGESNGQFYEGVRGADFIRKALLDDSTSGGTGLVPVVVDNVIVSEAILTGELLPYVSVRPVSARQVKSPTLSTPALTWGVPEGTAIPLFDTTSMLGSLQTTVFPVVGAVEVGLDLLEDSAPDVGAALIEVMGQAFGREADRVIAVGDGVNMPLGIFLTSGVTAVSSVSGAGGPVAMSDYENLFFAIGKANRAGASNVRLIGNDVTYQRLRTIPAGASFNVRAFGDALSDYRIGQVPFSVVNSLPNNKLACAALKRYVLFRRAGFTSEWETRGETLRLKNLALLISRGRFGGRLTDVTAAAVITDLAA